MKQLIFIFFFLNSVAFGQHYFNKSYEFSDNGNQEAFKSIKYNQFSSEFWVLGTVFTDNNPRIYKVSQDGYGLDTLKVPCSSSGSFFFPGEQNSLLIDETENAFIVGQINFAENVQTNAIMFNINKFGDTLWTYETDNGIGTYSGFTSIERARDGNIIVVGFSDKFGFGQQFYLLKMSPFGDVLWEKNYGSFQDDIALSVDTSNTGGYVLSGYSNNIIGYGKTDIFVVNVDVEGNLLWEKRFGGPSFDSGLIKTLKNGHFLIYGAASFINPLNDLDFASHGLALELDNDGNELWRNNYSLLDSNSLDYFFYSEGFGSVIEMNDGYILLGQCQEPITDDIFGWIVKIDKYGNVIWNRRLRNRFGNNYLRDLETQNGDLIAAGFLEPNELNSQDGWILRTNCLGFEGPPLLAAEITKDSINNSATIINSSQRFGDGLIDWGDGTQTYFTEHDDTIFTHVYSENGDYSINFQINACNDHDSLQFETKITNVLPPAPPLSNFSIYPNPANQSFTIKYLPTNDVYSVTISIYDLAGRQVYSESITNFYNETTFDVSNYSAGTYLIRFSTEMGDVFIEKLVVYH